MFFVVPNPTVTKQDEFLSKVEEPHSIPSTSKQVVCSSLLEEGLTGVTHLQADITPSKEVNPDPEQFHQSIKGK